MMGTVLFGMALAMAAAVALVPEEAPETFWEPAGGKKSSPALWWALWGFGALGVLSVIA